LSAKFRQPMDTWTGAVYQRAKLALITGWPLGYIDQLGWFDFETVLQVHEAENFVEIRNGN